MTGQEGRSSFTRPDWVIRVLDDYPDDHSRAEITAAITDRLKAIGLTVLSVAPPMELNPEPLRIAGGGEPLYRIRVSAPVLGWFSGTGDWQDMQLFERRGDVPSLALAPTAARHWVKLFAAQEAKDGSRTVHLTKEEADDLREYADYMAGAAADNAGPDDHDALGELNAARALIRQIDRKLEEKP